MPFDLQEFFDRLNQHILSTTSPNNNRDILFCFRIYEVLKKQAQELNETLPDHAEFKSFKASLTKLQAEQGSISSGEVQKYLWQFFYICHSMLPLSDAGARVGDKTLIPIHNHILNCLYALTNCQNFRATENQFDSFINAFRNTEDIFTFSGLSSAVIQELKGKLPSAMELATTYCSKADVVITSKSTPNDWIKLFNEHIKYCSENHEALNLNRVFSVFLFLNFSHKLDIFPEDKLQHQTIRFADIHEKFNPEKYDIGETIEDIATAIKEAPETFLIKYICYQNTLIKDAWFRYFFELSTSSDFQNVYKDEESNDLDPKHKNNFTYAVTLASELTKPLPKNIASGTPTTVQKPIKNILKLPAWISNIVTGRKTELAAKVIKSICRFYLTMQPYTPEALTVLVGLYRHTFNKFINLDDEIHNAIFANRDLLTPEISLEFLYCSFQCQKEKKILNKEILRYLNEIKEVLPEKITRKNIEEITLKVVIELSQDCVIQTRQYDLYISTAQSPSSTEIVYSSNNPTAKKNHTTQQKKQLEPEERKRIINTLIGLIKETIDVEDRFATSMQKFSAGMEKHKERIPELAKGGDLLKSIIPHCKAVAKNLFHEVSITENSQLIVKEKNLNLCTEISTEINLNAFKILIQQLIEIFTSEDFNDHAKNFPPIKTAYNQLTTPHGKCYFDLPEVIEFAKKYEDDYGNKETQAGQGISGQLIKPALQQLPRYRLLITNISKTFNALYPAEHNAENKDIKEIHIMMNYLIAYIERVLGNANDAKQPVDPDAIKKFNNAAKSYTEARRSITMDTPVGLPINTAATEIQQNNDTDALPNTVQPAVYPSPVFGESMFNKNRRNATHQQKILENALKANEEAFKDAKQPEPLLPPVHSSPLSALGEKFDSDSLNQLVDQNTWNEAVKLYFSRNN